MTAPPDSIMQQGAGLFDEIGGMLDDGLIIANASGEIQSANNAAIRLFGEGLVGTPLDDVLLHEDIDQFLRSKQTEHMISFIPDSDVAMEFKIRLRRLQNHMIMVLILDMTLQRNLEKVRRDFVANVSHELRSPLTSMAGFIETILMNEVRDWPTQERFLRIMDEEAGRMSRLIDDLLSLSRVEVDEHNIPDETVPVMEVLRSVVGSLETRASRNNMKIIVDDRRPEGGPRLMINGFSDEVNEVFHNLIDNAVKYGFAQTDITVTVNPVQDGHVAIAVGNSGEPIAKKHIDRLTERFYRVDKARSRKIGGTGLGLAIVKHIVNRHRGHLHVSSSPEGETSFTVRLPVLHMSESSDRPETGHKTVT